MKKASVNKSTTTNSDDDIKLDSLIIAQTSAVSYTIGKFLTAVAEKITNNQTIAKAWEQTSYDQLNKINDNIIARSFFKNIDQYKNDKLNKPSQANHEDIVMCDKKMGYGRNPKKTTCEFLKTGITFEPKQEL